MAERFKARVRGRSLAGVAGSNPAGGMDVCVVSEDKKAKRRTIKTQKQIPIKYKVQNKNPAEGMDNCVVCCRGISDVRKKDIKIHKWIKST